MSKEINDLKQQIMWLQNQNALLINKQEALRDHFAGLAMQSYITIYCNKGISDCPDDCQIAEYSYHQADAMIAERNEND